MPYIGKVLLDDGPPEFRLIRRGHLLTVHVAFWKWRPTHQIVAKPDGLVSATYKTVCGMSFIENTQFVFLEDFRMGYPVRLCRNCLRIAEARQWLLDGNWKLDPVVPPQFEDGDPMGEMDSDVMRRLARIGLDEPSTE